MNRLIVNPYAISVLLYLCDLELNLNGKRSIGVSIGVVKYQKDRFYAKGNNSLRYELRL